MALMDASDWGAMNADLMDMRSDNPTTITIRRGNATVAAQVVRIASIGGGATTEGTITEAAIGSVTILGDLNLDIRPQDRFTANGLLYEVSFVDNNRRAAKMAEARLIQ